VSRGGPTFDQERVHLNVARMRKGGEDFEVVVDADNAVLLREGAQVDIKDILKAEKIFADARKGELASEEHMQSLFGTNDALTIAPIILREGEIQLTQEHRERVRQAKYNQLVNFIHMNAINPQTSLVHPEERVRRAMEEARVRVDVFKRPEDQISEVVRQLQPILPIKFTTFIVELHLPAEHAAKYYGFVQQRTTIAKEQWLNDGSLAATVELPAGQYASFIEELSSKTHGSVEVSKQEK
jgi:ribosome maturation protein SDO1